VEKLFKKHNDYQDTQQHTSFDIFSIKDTDYKKYDDQNSANLGTDHLIFGGGLAKF